MLSIDEAIEKYKEITNTKAICPGHCNISCDKCLQESKQIAEWLEELKSYRAHIFSGDMTQAMLKEQYCKAIDDFVKFANTMPTVEEEDGEIRPMWLEEMAEQLKAGGENENYNKKES